MRFLKNRFFQNTSWMVGGKVAQMIISLFVGMITARYLGPGNYGIINYTNSFIVFFNSICTLGLNAIIVRELVNNPTKQGEIIGSSIVMRCISSLISIISIMFLISYFNPGDKLIQCVAILQTIGVIFNSFDLINYWYQSKLQSKYPTIITLMAYIVMSIYKIIIIVLQKNVIWFAFSSSLDIICIAIFLMVTYKKSKGPKLKFSILRCKLLISKSYHYILSGLMVAIYGQMDKIMIGKIVNIQSVGLYSTAVYVCSLWTFVLYALIDSARPIIIESRNKDYRLFVKRIKQLYASIIWISILVSVLFTIFSEYIILVLYGREFLGAVSVLKIVTWYTSFSFLGIARSIWMVCENKNKYEKRLAFWGAISNLVLNFILIPKIGINGAAIATLLTEIISNLIIPFLYKETRVNSKYIIQAFLLKGVLW